MSRNSKLFPSVSQLLLQNYRDGQPPLPDGCDYHLYVVKHEEHKAKAENIATALRDVCGFKVWLSQWQGLHKKDVNKDAMQKGIRKSAAILLLFTPGIFQMARVWCTHTELMHAMDLGKPIIAIMWGKVNLKRNLRCLHAPECCLGVRADFQPYARVISDVINMSD